MKKTPLDIIWALEAAITRAYGQSISYKSSVCYRHGLYFLRLAYRDTLGGVRIPESATAYSRRAILALVRKLNGR